MERKNSFSKAREPSLSYNSLMDPHLATYFTNPRIRRHLRHAGLILPDGEAVSEQTYRLFAGKLNQREQVQEQLIEAWARQSLRLSRSRSVTLSRWIEQLQKHELVNRIREEELKRSGSVPSGLLSRRPGSRSSLVVFNAKTESPSPFKQQADTGRRSSKRVASASLVDRSARHKNRGSSCASASVRTSSESSRGIESVRRKFPSRSNSFSSARSSSSLSSSQSSSSSTVSSSSSSVSSLSSENESYLGSSYSQSLLSSEVSSQVKAKAKNRQIIRIPRTDSHASWFSSDVEKESGPANRPKSAVLQGFRVPHPPKAKGEGSRSQINDKTTKKDQRVIRKLSGASEQKCDPSTPFFSAIRPNLKHNGCLVTLHFLGSALELHSELTDKCNDISVEQQHCGGNTVTAFKGRIPAKSDFAFYSYRRHHYPFSVTIYVDGRQDSRLSYCCEYKHSAGVRLGGLTGHFVMVGVRGGKPCYRCEIKAQVKDEDKQKRHENYSSDCSQHQEKDSAFKRKSRVSYISQNYEEENIAEKKKQSHEIHRTEKRDKGNAELKQNKEKIKINKERQRIEEVREVSHSESEDGDESNISQRSIETTEQKSDDDLDAKGSQINTNEMKSHVNRKSKKNYEGKKKNKSKGKEQYSHESQEHKHRKHRKHSKNQGTAVTSISSAGKAKRKNSLELAKEPMDSLTKFKHNEHHQEKDSELDGDNDVDDVTVSSSTPSSSRKDRLHIDIEVLGENANSPHSSAKDNHAENDLKRAEKKKSSHAYPDSNKSREKTKVNGHEEEFESADERKLRAASPGDGKELPEQQCAGGSSSDEEDPDDVENGNVVPIKPLLAKKHDDVDKTHKDSQHQLSLQGSASDDESEDESAGEAEEQKGEDSPKENLSSSRSRSILFDSEDHRTNPHRMKDKDSRLQKEELADSASEEVSGKESSPVNKCSHTNEGAMPGRLRSDQRNSISGDSSENEDDSPRINNKKEISRPDEINSNLSRESNNKSKEADVSSFTTGSLDWNAARSCKNINNENDSDF